MANYNPPKNGLDKRPAAINKGGRPKSFDAWRTMLQEIANEPAVQSKDNVKRLVLIKIPKVVDGKPVFEEDGITPVMVDHYATNAEMVARQIMSDPKRQVMFIEGAYGKVPQAVALTGENGGPVQLTVVYQSKPPKEDNGDAG